MSYEWLSFGGAIFVMFCCGLVNLLEEVQQVLEAETGAFERDGTPSMARWREEESMGWLRRGEQRLSVDIVMPIGVPFGS